MRDPFVLRRHGRRRRCLAELGAAGGGGGCAALGTMAAASGAAPGACLSALQGAVPRARPRARAARPGRGCRAGAAPRARGADGRVLFRLRRGLGPCRRRHGLLQQLNVDLRLILKRGELLARQALQLLLPALRQGGPTEELQELGPDALEQPTLRVDHPPIRNLLREEGMLLHAGHGPALLRELVREHPDQVQGLVPAALRGLAWLQGQGRKLRRPLPTSARGGANGGDGAAGRVQVELRGAWSLLSLSDPPAAWRVWQGAWRVWRPPGSLLASSSTRTEENDISVHVDLDAVGGACR
mmetsp:Transcript_40676/g.103511  ORF Transcript_40676/g.103511 Transcript_40676/m.103511 type:complete len:299 (-) Transcript_40676:557-1453(-)